MRQFIPLFLWAVFFFALIPTRLGCWFWGSTGSLLFLAAAFGGLGAVSRIAYGILSSKHSGSETSVYAWDGSVAPFCSAVLAVVFVLAGLSNLAGLSLSPEPKVVSAWGALVGLFFPQALEKLREVSGVLLAGAKKESPSEKV